MAPNFATKCKILCTLLTCITHKRYTLHCCTTWSFRRRFLSYVDLIHFLTSPSVTSTHQQLNGSSFFHPTPSTSTKDGSQSTLIFTLHSNTLPIYSTGNSRTTPGSVNFPQGVGFQRQTMKPTRTGWISTSTFSACSPSLVCLNI